MNKFFIALLMFGLGVLSSPTTCAQSLLSAKEGFSEVATLVEIDGLEGEENWAVYADENNRKFYIDLEKIHILLDKITVVDEKDNVVYNDNLWNLTPNTIYEIDMTAFEAGKYRLEFISLTDERFVKNFDIK
jgi:Domain of unknown function (DUF3244)